MPKEIRFVWHGVLQLLHKGEMTMENPVKMGGSVAGSCDTQIEAWFTYHAPSPAQQERYIELRSAAKNMAYAIRMCTPPGADQSAAFRLLRECVFTANASIALEGKV